MRALVSTPDREEPGEVRAVAEPQSQPSDAVIEVKATSLNRGELRQLAASADWVPGQDVAGVVLRTAADGSGLPEGRRTAALGGQGLLTVDWPTVTGPAPPAAGGSRREEGGRHGSPDGAGAVPAGSPHLDQIRDVAPRTDGCEEYLATGDAWVALSLCLTCGHVG